MAVLISGVEVWRGFIHNLAGLRLTPRKQGSFQSVARSVVKTTGSLPSCQQAQSIGSQCRPSRTNPLAPRRRPSQISPSPRIQHATEKLHCTMPDGSVFSHINNHHAK